MMGRSSKKLQILHAAAKVVAQDGIFNLTLEAVAREAGISKGGLLYHYASKEKLVEDMVMHLADLYREKIHSAAEEDEQQRGRFSRAYLDVTMNKSDANKEMNTGLLAAKAVNPLLMKPIREAYAHWQSQLEDDGIDPILATIVRLVSDGIWLTQLLDIPPLRPELLCQVRTRLGTWIAIDAQAREKENPAASSLSNP